MAVGRTAMCHRARHLALVVVTAMCVGGLGCGEAIAQRTKMLDFGPDAIELAPPGRAVADPSLAARAEPDAKVDRPWVLRSASALRLPPPPGERESAAER